MKLKKLKAQENPVASGKDVSLYCYYITINFLYGQSLTNVLGNSATNQIQNYNGWTHSFSLPVVNVSRRTSNVPKSDFMENYSINQSRANTVSLSRLKIETLKAAQQILERLL